MPKTSQISNKQIIVLKKNLGRTATDLILFLSALLNKKNEKYGLFHEDRQWLRNTHKNLGDKIGVSISTIQRAVRKLEEIGIIVKGKFEEGKNYRGGKYVSYFTIDFDVLGNFFGQFEETKEEFANQKEGGSFTQMVGQTHENDTTEMTNNFNKTNNRVGQNNQYISDKLSLNLKNTQQDYGEGQNLPLSKPQTASKKQNEDFHTVCQSMYDIWNEIVFFPLQAKNLGKLIQQTEVIQSFLYKAFEDCFGRDMNQWKSYCEKIASIDFLMGGGERKFAARLDWVLKFSIIERIQSGVYDFDENKQKNSDKKQKDKAASPEKLLPVVMPEELSFEEKNLRKLLLEELGQGLYVGWIQSSTIEFSSEEGVKPTLIAESDFVACRIESCPQLRKITHLFDKIDWKKPTENEQLERLTEQVLDQETETTIKNMARANKMDVKEVLQSLEADVMEDIKLAENTDHCVINAVEKACDDRQVALITKDVDLALKQALLRKRAMIAGNVGYLNYKSWFKGSRILQVEEGDILHVDTNFQKDTMCQRFEKVMEGFIDIQVVNQPSLKLCEPGDLCFVAKRDNNMNTLSLAA